MHNSDVSFTRSEAEDLVAHALLGNRVSQTNARIVAHALVNAERDGQAGHGFSRVASYAAQAAAGKVDGFAVPVAAKAAPAWIAVDAANGFAFPALDLAISELCALARETGIACATVHRSHHCGQLGAHVERLAERGLVALMFANAPKAMAPWGGSMPLFGTNPIAFAAPRLRDAPLVIDLSLSKVARGKILAASKAGKEIPEGWALDEKGQPTTDAKAALAGTMIPTGDVKGASLALMVEILSATLTGANYSSEASSFFDAIGPSPGVGQTIIAFAPRQTAGHDFAARLETLITEMLSQEGVRLPGSKRIASRIKADTDGLVIPGHLHAEIARLVKA